MFGNLRHIVNSFLPEPAEQTHAPRPLVPRDDDRQPRVPVAAVGAEKASEQRAPSVSFDGGKLRHIRSSFAETARLKAHLTETTGLQFESAPPAPRMDKLAEDLPAGARDTSAAISLHPDKVQRMRSQFASTTSLANDVRQRITEATAQASNTLNGQSPTPLSPQVPLDQRDTSAPSTGPTSLTIGPQKLRLIRNTFAETARLTEISQKTILAKTGQLPSVTRETTRISASLKQGGEVQAKAGKVVEAPAPALNAAGKVNADPAVSGQACLTLGGPQLRRIRSAFATSGWSSATA